MKIFGLGRFFMFLPWILIIIIILDVMSNKMMLQHHLGLLSGRTDRVYNATQACFSMCAENRSNLPTIYAITPTYTRPVQRVELTRLSHTFRQVPNFHWIVVEDAKERTDMVTRHLAGCGVPYTHLNAHTPQKFRRRWMWRGIEQRNEALSWLRQHRTQQQSGVVYFADDDNTYTLELFEEMRDTRKVSIWPVGFVAGRHYEGPVVSEGKVVGWYSGWRPDRPFAIDMAGFAVNLQVILADPQIKFRWKKAVAQETNFLEQFATMADLEPKASNCTKVLVWHTHTTAPLFYSEPKTPTGPFIEV